MVSDRLASEWGMVENQADAFDEREAITCERCGLCLRVMGLAAAILRSYRFPGPFGMFAVANAHRAVLEINSSDLSRYLQKMPRRVLVGFPEVAIERLPFADESFDLVIHSETLEHVDDPVQGLRECRRVLKPGGRLAYTIPVLPDRLTESRDGKPVSYHGDPQGGAGFPVAREYGADFWTEPIEAGFDDVEIVMFQAPMTFAIIARPSRRQRDGVVVRTVDRVSAEALRRIRKPPAAVS